MNRFRNWPDWALAPLLWLQSMFFWLAERRVLMSVRNELHWRGLLDPEPGENGDAELSEQLDGWYLTDPGRHLDEINAAMQAFWTASDDIAQWCLEHPEAELTVRPLGLFFRRGTRSLSFYMNGRAGLALLMEEGGKLALERRLYPRSSTHDLLHYTIGDTHHALMDSLTWLAGADDAPGAP